MELLSQFASTQHVWLHSIKSPATRNDSIIRYSMVNCRTRIYKLTVTFRLRSVTCMAHTHSIVHPCVERRIDFREEILIRCANTHVLRCDGAACVCTIRLQSESLSFGSILMWNRLLWCDMYAHPHIILSACCLRIHATTSNWNNLFRNQIDSVSINFALDRNGWIIFANRDLPLLNWHTAGYGFGPRSDQADDVIVFVCTAVRATTTIFTASHLIFNTCIDRDAIHINSHFVRCRFIAKCAKLLSINDLFSMFLCRRSFSSKML